MAKDLTAIRIDGESVEKLKQISQESDGLYFDRSVNWLIGQAVKEFIERHSSAKQGKPDRRDTTIARKRDKREPGNR
jgi:hypothetical protein